MAENKKSFVLYSDSYGMIKQLPDDIAGRLFKHIYAFVNDENPTTDEVLLNIAFEPIKMQLKRDLQKWENKKNTFSNAGIESGKVRSLDCKNQLYAVRIFDENESFVKIGITFNSISKRFSQGKGGIKQCGYDYEILYQIYENQINNKSVLEFETFIHSRLNKFSYIPKKQFSGYTECFSCDCINEIERTLILFNETQRNLTVNDNVNVNVNDNDILLKKETKEGFKETKFIPLNIQEKKEKKIAPKKESQEKINASDDFILIWNDYIDYRKAKKKSFRFAGLKWEQQSFDKFYQLSKGDIEIAKKILNQTIVNNWEGLFDIKENNNTQKNERKITKNR